MLNPEKFNQYMSHMNQELYNYKLNFPTGIIHADA